MLRLGLGIGRSVSDARAARTSIQPENEAPKTPAADNLRKSRRDFSRRLLENMATPAFKFQVSSFKLQSQVGSYVSGQLET